MTVMVLGGALTTLLIVCLPRERVVMSRWREAFFLSWKLSLVAFIAPLPNFEVLHQRADQRLNQAKRERPAAPARRMITG